MISLLKITKGNDSAKRSILTIYKITKSGQTFICTKFREIISNGIKVIERT